MPVGLHHRHLAVSLILSVIPFFMPMEEVWEVVVLVAERLGLAVAVVETRAAEVITVPLVVLAGMLVMVEMVRQMEAVRLMELLVLAVAEEAAPL